MTLSEVTSRPKTRPSLTSDGVSTGMHITLHDSVGMTRDGEAMPIPAGTLLTAPLAGGESWKLGCAYSECSIGTDGPAIQYRA